METIEERVKLLAIKIRESVESSKKTIGQSCIMIRETHRQIESLKREYIETTSLINRDV